MAKCVECSKKGLFLKINAAGVCFDCVSVGMDNARAFHNLLVEEYSRLPKGLACKYSAELGIKDMSREDIAKTRESCAFLQDNIPKWAEYPYFISVFKENLVDHKGESVVDIKYYFSYRHSVFRGGSVSLDDTFSMNDYFSVVLKEISEINFSCIRYKPYESEVFRVVGVTFDDRQSTIRKVYFKDAPYNNDPVARLNKTEHEGEAAFSVSINDKVVGYISKDKVPFVLERWENYSEITYYEVFGGGVLPSGESGNYGISIRVKFLK